MPDAVLTTFPRTPSRLIDLARAAYAARSIVDAEELADRESKAAEEFLTSARRTARDVLGEPADDLPWRYTPWVQAREDTEEATAVLPPGIRHQFALRYAHIMQSDASTCVELALVQTCNSCGCSEACEVTSLEHLGQLLEQADGIGQPHGDTHEVGESQPLTAIAALQDLTTRISELAHRLAEAGLTVDTASVFSTSSGATTCKMRAEADTAEAVVTTATSVGLDVDVDIHATAGTYVFRRARASGDVGGVELQLSGYTQLPVDEAAAWQAQQNQTAEPIETGGTS